MSSTEQNPPPVARVRRAALLGLLLLVLWMAYRVIRPYLDPIILATVLAALLHSFFRWLRGRLRNRATPAALLTCALVLLLLLGPVALLAGTLVREGIASLHAIQQWLGSGGLERAMASGPVARVEHLLRTLLPGLQPGHFDLAGTLSAGSSAAAAWLLRNGGSLVGQAGGLLGKLFLMIFVLFYFLRDGQRLLTSTLHLVPLDADQEERLIQRFKAVSRSAILGAFGTAAAQGLAGGIGLAIVGLPGLFWGTVMALASLIPVVGTALVWVPATLYLLAVGSTGKAIFLALYCGIAVGSIDNLLRPWLMSGQARMSTLWLFLAILGGIDAFGLMGLIYGPLIFGLLAVLLYLYQEEFEEYLAGPDRA